MSFDACNFIYYNMERLVFIGLIYPAIFQSDSY